MSTCPTCGTQYGANVRLCPSDGTVLEAEPAQDPRVGKVLDSKYRLDSRLSSGGMGTVYKATHLMLVKIVAVKLINPELVTSPDIVRRFQREARAASNLNHPNIAAAYDLGQTDDGTLYIAMEFVNGPSLKEVIRKGGPLESGRIVTILRQVASALSLAHRHNIIHRDLKPHNIMLTKDDSGHEMAKLLDFGIAKTFDEAATQQLTATGFAIGTPQYMAPEQAAGKPVDGRSDLYSLGVVMYEMLVGEVPFNDTSTPAVLVKHMTEVPPQPSRRRPDLNISPGLEAVALKCLEKDPAMRFQTADEFSLALTQAGEATTASPAAASVASAAPTIVMPAPATSAATATTAVGQPAAQPSAGSVSQTATTNITGAAAQATKTHLDAAPPAAAAAVTPAPAAASARSRTPSGGSDLPTADLPAARATATPAASTPAAATPAPAAPAAASTPTPAATAPTATRIPAVQPAAASAPPPASMAASAASSSPMTASATTETARSSRGSLAAGLVLLMLLVGGVGFAAYRMGYWSGPRPTAPTAATEKPAIEAPVSTPQSAPAIQPLDAPGAPTSANAAPPAGRQTSATPQPSPSAVTPPTGKRASTEPGSTKQAPAVVPNSGATRSTAAPPPSSATYGATPQSPQPPAAAMPDNPSVSFRCSGPTEVCSALRAAVGEALEQASLPSVPNAQRADILVDASVAVVDEHVSQQFGTTFAVRTFSIDVSGEARRSGDAVPMPAPASVSYDARVGQERLNERARLTADAIVEKIRAYLKKR
jgi:serine/threonine-protein kinase